MDLGRIGILSSALVLASCLDDDVLGDGQPEIDVTAEFSATPVTGTAPLVVQFTDESEGDVGSWEWDFGDSELSPFHSPSHTYTDPGTYTVKLHVVACTSAVNCEHAFEVKADLITVTAPVVGSSPPGLPPETFSAGAPAPRRP